MKITGFNTQIISKDPQAVVALFEALGFNRTHNKTSDEDVVFSSIRMKDANGYHVDVIEVENVPANHDLTAIRINVDDFDAAYQLLIDHGFRESKSFGVHYTPTSKYAYLISPSGFLIGLCLHIKK